MKKRIKIINLFLLLGIVFSPLFGYAETNEYQKGDLRCPTQINDSNVKCTAIKDKNGVVTEVDITYGSIKNSGDVQIVKKVKKTSILGRYEISFQVKGKNLAAKEVYKDTSIVLVLDMSKTVEDSVDEIKAATMKFYNTLKTMDNVKLAIIQFAGESYIKKTFSATSFTLSNYNQDKLGKKSHVEKALAQVDSLLTGDNLKYVVLLGDGQYWSSADTDVEASKERFNSLRNKGIKFYMIQYSGGLAKYNEDYKKPGQYNRYFISSYVKPTKWWCNYGNYDYSVRSWCTNNQTINYDTIFQEVANSLKEEVISASVLSEGTLIDRVGSNFSIDGSYSNIKKFNIGDITEAGTTTSPFYIDINEYAEDGWHETNGNFNFSYTGSDGSSKTITCNENPEVFWIQQKLEVHSCTGVATADTVKSADSDESTYFEKICLEGYLKDNQYKNGLSVSMKINNLESDMKNFTLKGGVGFPISIDLSTNLMCQYIFYSEDYNKAYTDITTKLNKTKDAKELASLTKQKEKLDKVLTNYRELTKNDMDEYIDRFTLQTATLKVSYQDTGQVELVTFKNSKEITSSKSCPVAKKQTINGKDVTVNQTCYLSLSKSLELPLTCLSMKTGKKEECNSLNNQIAGGNQFYTNLSERGGSLFIELSDAGYSGMLNIKLDGCSYTSSNTDILYRQIDVVDPFLKTYNAERKVGKNYLNSKYNFVNIIKSDIWSQSYAYQYLLSKVNVDSIRKDTAEEGITSYLGRSCSFSASGTYLCDFTRNNDFFSNVKIN